MIAHPDGLDHFFSKYQLWLATTTTSFSIMVNFLWGTNFGCADSTWVFMGVIPLILPYFIKKILKVERWHKSRALTYSILQTMHHNIYGFSRSIGKLSLQQKKPQHNEVQLCGFQVIACACITTNCCIWTSTKFETTTGFEVTWTNIDKAMHMHILNIWCWWCSINTTNGFNQLHVIIFSHHSLL